MDSHPLGLRCVYNPYEHCTFPMCNSKEYQTFQKSTMYVSCAAIPSDSGACATYTSTVYFPCATQKSTVYFPCATHKSTVYFPCATQKSTIYFKRALCTSHVQTPPPTHSHVQLKRALYISHVQLKRAPYISKEHHTFQKSTMYFPCADASSDSGVCATQKSTVYFPCAKEHHTFPMCTQNWNIFSKSTVFFPWFPCAKDHYTFETSTV